MSNTARHTITTTANLGVGLLIRIAVEDGNYSVADVVGARYGFSPVLADALTGWAEQVDDILSIPDAELGEPLQGEVAAYKRALGLSGEATVTEG